MAKVPTLEEFERDYAYRSGVTVEWLHAHGREAVPCDCGDDLCDGWAMFHPADGIEPLQRSAERRAR